VRLAVIYLMLAVSLLQAQVIPGRFIVELADEPATVTKSAAETSRARVRTALESKGLRVVGSTTHVLNALVVEGADAAALRATPGVRKVYPVVTVRKSLDRALNLHRIPEAWNLLNGSSNQGEGIRIGILDTGIDVTHPGFQDESMKAPEGFPKGSAASELSGTNGKVIVARQYTRGANSSSRDGDGHGTGVAMIAAGRAHNGPRGPMTGVAPKAWLGNYKVLNDSGSGSTDIVLEAVDDAVADGMQVLNMSFGSFPALRPGDDIMVRAVERAVAAGLIVVTAAGNEGPHPATLSSPAIAPSAIAVGNSANERIYATFVRAGANAAIAALPGNATGMPDSVSGALVDVLSIDSTGQACQALPSGSLQGRVALILRGECDFEVKLNFATVAGAVGAIVYSRPEDPDAVHMGVGRATLPAVSVNNSDGLLLRDQAHNEPFTEVVLALTPALVSTSPNRIAGSSSRGPDPNAGVKPELLAVGTSVYTALTSQRGVPAWQISSGTSFSSPLVAGVAALLRAARPGLTVAQYRSLLINSSGELSATAGEPFPLQSAGAGRMNAAGAMLTTVAAVPATLSFGVGASSTVTRDRPVTLTNLAAAPDTLTLSVTGYGKGPLPELSQNTVSLAAGASREIALRFSGTELAPGGYGGLLLVRSTLSDSEARIPWWFAVPSDKVSVLTLVEGQDSVRASGAANVYVRPTDANGFPVEIRPEVTVVSGGGRVVGVQAHLLYAGFYTVALRMGPSAGNNAFDITAGGVTRRLVIVAN